MKIEKAFFFAVVICSFSTSCENQIKFDKAGWAKIEDLGIYPNRNKMLNDLTKNHKLKGLTYRQLVEEIGEPEKNVSESSNTLYYNIVTDYGHDIDPVYSKTLQLNFDKDSIIIDFKINETKH